MDRIIVTGGAGYIGSHVCKALAERNLEPVAVDDLRTGRREAVRWGAFEQVAVENSDGLTQVIRRHKPVAAIHLAGLIMAGESVAKPLEYHQANVGGMLGLLQAMRATGLETLVFSSTASVYGIPAICPVTEAAPLAPVNPYGASKAICERLLDDCAAAGWLRPQALRYFNACGADDSGHIGEMHHPETHLIPLTIRAALEDGHVLAVHGNDYDTADGTGIRDYVHVSDIAEAHLLALDHLWAGKPGQPMNLGTGTGFSVRQVIAEVERQTGCPVKMTEGPRRPGDTPVLVADAQLARRVLGWTPRRSDLPTMVGSACAWHGRNGWPSE
ncbi:MAG: UDP-glucose 4-epimerase GalE [Rhodospirillaceae bacterium]|nr:UDP-glucose 4-epimerase GalE [Rhodospirillales bacterium]